MSEVLITGGAGFIGSHLQDTLLEQGHAVTVIDNIRTGRRNHINKRATFYEVDVRDRERLEKVIKDVRPQVVFHLAAQNDRKPQKSGLYFNSDLNTSVIPARFAARRAKAGIHTNYLWIPYQACPGVRPGYGMTR